MGVRLSGGVGPVRASVPLDGCLTAFGVIFYWSIVAAVWIAWAVIALSVAGIALLARKKDLSRKWVRTLYWGKLAPASNRKRTFHGTAELEDGRRVSCQHHHRTEGAALECAARISRRGGII